MLRFTLVLVLMVMLGVAVAATVVVWRPETTLALPVERENGPKQLAQNLWFPKEASANLPGPEVTAKAAFFVNTKTGDVLYQKDAQARYPIASLTKIMTAIITLENRQLNEVVVISERAAAMEPDSMLLKAGESLTVEELLQGLFLVSGNDAAEALAESTTGRREEFLNLMNSKARQLGMNNTVFINPSGLQEDGVQQYSTAYEVALMSRYAISQFPQLVQITSQPRIVIPANPWHQDYDLYSGINLLTTYPGVVGFKTGYTPEAGLTLVTLARRGDYEVLGVLLGAEDRREDAKKLLDYSFAQLGVQP